MYENNVKLLNGNPYLFLHVDGLEKQGFSGSYCNSGEAKAILQLVQNLKVLSDSNNIAWHSPEKIRIITFYQAQVSLIKRMLTECGLGRIVVATVDSSQGCEADIVIISFVRSNSRGNHSAAGFLADDRRLNVALTRAKYQLICVGNVRGLQNMTGASTLQFLSNNAYERNSVINEEQNNSHKKEGTAIASNPENIQNQTLKKRRKVN
jgi:superfamily I DNA and/or RNA helicase